MQNSLRSFVKQLVYMAKIETGKGIWWVMLLFLLFLHLYAAEHAYKNHISLLFCACFQTKSNVLPNFQHVISISYILYNKGLKRKKK